jgi:hypothetical protein
MLTKIRIFVLMMISGLHVDALTAGGQLSSLATLKSSLCLNWPTQPNCTNSGSGVVCNSNGRELSQTPFTLSLGLRHYELVSVHFREQFRERFRISRN